ncbi:hypothetical protein [Evansella clarkii]|uniref:hypothetical protein n=1 Tax=Evansella clarkii TaxID=79879 RepID=UPI000996B56D|nr:hypothetical protein [Evansella clarkii]
MLKRGAVEVFEKILINTIKTPGIRVNRENFLKESLGKYADTQSQLETAIEKSPLAAGVQLSVLDATAVKLIEKRTKQTSAASLVSTMPLGAPMAATVPADMLQYMSISIRLAQELAYLYGFKGFWDGENMNSSRVKEEIILFLGVMAKVKGAASIIRIIKATDEGRTILNFPRKSIIKLMYYPILRKITTLIVTKQSFSKGITKVVPMLGGPVSGGWTFAKMKVMGERLRKVLSDASRSYKEEDLLKDLRAVKHEVLTEIGYEYTGYRLEAETSATGKP